MAKGVPALLQLELRSTADCLFSRVEIFGKIVQKQLACSTGAGAGTGERSRDALL